MKTVYNLVITKKEKFFIATSLDFGISTLGHNLEEAIKIMKNAIIFSKITGCPISEPSSEPIPSSNEAIETVTVDLDTDSDKLDLLNRVQAEKKDIIAAWRKEEAEAKEVCTSQDSLVKKEDMIILCAQAFETCIVVDFSDGSRRNLYHGFISNDDHLKTIKIINGGKAVSIVAKIEFPSSVLRILGTECK